MGGGGHNCIWCKSCRRIFVSLCYLLNQWMDFDQTCINILLGGRKELIRFDDLDLIFKVTPALKCPRWGFRTLSFEPNNGYWPNFIYCFTVTQ